MEGWTGAGSTVLLYMLPVPRKPVRRRRVSGRTLGCHRYPQAHQTQANGTWQGWPIAMLQRAAVKWGLYSHNLHGGCVHFSFFGVEALIGAGRQGAASPSRRAQLALAVAVAVALRERAVLPADPPPCLGCRILTEVSPYVDITPSCSCPSGCSPGSTDGLCPSCSMDHSTATKSRRCHRVVRSPPTLKIGLVRPARMELGG